LLDQTKQCEIIETSTSTSKSTVTFKDRPCGSGKTSDLLESFEPNEKHFVVVPTRDEIDRVLQHASVPFSTPKTGEYFDEHGVKRTSLLMGLGDLIDDGENIVCTHELFDMVNINECDLRDYNVVLDEVFDCVKGFNGPAEDSFQKIYIDGGLLVVDEAGELIPSDKWRLQGDDAYKHKCLKEAVKGRLYRSGQGFYVTVVPIGLFTKCKSCTVLTYLAEGSLMARFLDRQNIPFTIEKNTALDKEARDQARNRLNIHYLDLGITKAQGYTGQGKWSKGVKAKVTNKLRNLRGRPLRGLAPERIMITCRKDIWYGSNEKLTSFPTAARMNKAKWVHKSTKGTNAFKDCTHAIHIYDINLNPSVKKFLKMSTEQEDLWRQSELIQWIYRTDLRNDSNRPVEFYITSKPMKELVENWLSDNPMQ
jgi:hypothetical protein